MLLAMCATLSARQRRVRVSEHGLLVRGVRVVPQHRGHKMPFVPKARIPRALNQERKHETLNATASVRVKM